MSPVRILRSLQWHAAWEMSDIYIELWRTVGAGQESSQAREQGVERSSAGKSLPVAGDCVGS